MGGRASTHASHRPCRGAKNARRRPGRSANDKTEEAAGGAAAAPAPPPVAKCATNARAEVEKWARRALEKGVEGLREEFLELKRYVPPDMTVQAFLAHHEAGRNRYKVGASPGRCP